MIRRLMVIAGVLALGVVAVAPGQGVCINSLTPGCECGLTLGGGGGIRSCDAAVASIYASATAVWTFNDPADLGNDSQGTNNLTPVASPTATGGALGHAMQTLDANNEIARADDSADTSVGPGISWGFAGWVVPTTGIDSRVPVAKADAADITTVEGGFDSFYLLATSFNCRFRDDVSLKTDTLADTAVAAGSKVFFHCRYNATSNELEAGAFAAWTGSPTSMNNDGADTTKLFTVGGHADAGTGSDIGGTIGPVWWYRSASGGEVLTDAFATSLYNSGKGKTCADTTETANLVSCWNMDDVAGGPYVDAIGSNDLTGINTPTRTAGLVERSDSGMSVNFVAASSQALTIVDNADLSLGADTPFTVAGWFFATDLATNRYLFGKRGTTNPTVEYTCFLNSNEVLSCFVSDGASAASVDSAVGQRDAWIFFAFRHDPVNDVLRLRVDSIDSTPVAWANGTQDTAQGFAVGRPGDWAANFMHGVLDNLALWKAHKTDAELDTLFNAGLGKFAAYWDAIFNGPRFAWSAAPEIKRAGS